MHLALVVFLLSSILLFSFSFPLSLIKTVVCSFMNTTHHVGAKKNVHLKGGSWISTGAESSRFARFAFRRHFFQHLGFRMVRSSKTTPARLCKAEVFVLGAGVTGK